MANDTFEANIYTPDWRFIAVLKDYISIIWTDRYYEIGDFELELPLTKENLQIYSPDNYIVCNQSDKVMIIEEIVTSTSNSGYRMKVKGHSAESLLRRRVTPNEIIINATTHNEKDVGGSKFAGGLATLFDACFSQESVEMMSESNNQQATEMSSESRGMSAIRFSGVVSDPFKHIADAVLNEDSHGDEYYDIIQKQCEAKDIGFAVYRNYEKTITRDDTDEDPTLLKAAKRYRQANTSGLFNLVLYDGWNQTGTYLNKNGAVMDTTINNTLYQVPSGIIFSVEYLNLQSSDSSYSKEEYKNYIFVKGDQIHSDSSASVDVAEATANFTEAYTDEDAKYYQVGTSSDKEYGIFRRETFADAGISRGLNTRRKYASRLRAKGSKLLRDQKEKMILSSEITNVNQFKYRYDYYLGDLVKVKDSMDSEDIFRVTEEIISCDAAGLKVYPTLVLFDKYKYVADDSLEDVDDSPRVLVNFMFNGGKMSPSDASNIYILAGDFYDKKIDPYTGKEKYDTWYWSSVSANNRVPLNTPQGTIIDTIPSVLEIQAALGNSSEDNPRKIADMLKGVRTYQVLGDYMVFPSDIGEVSNDPSVLGDYKVTKENCDLRYWKSYRRFIKFEEVVMEEATEVFGEETFDAHWSPTYYLITFEHGTGGKYSYSSFSGSYCLITEIPQWASQVPTFESGKFYERKRDWNKDAYSYVPLYSVPPGWYTEGSSTYYNKYYTNSKDTDRIYEDCAFGDMPKEPYVVPELGYRRDPSKWDPTIIKVVADATYTATWQKEDEAEDEEDGDDDEDWDDNDRDEVNSPVKHRTGAVQGNVFVGSDEGVDNATQLGTMVTFRSDLSRLFDVFLPDNNLHMAKVKDGPDQHANWVYRRDLSDGFYLQAGWASHYVPLPGVVIMRKSDNAVIANFYGSYGGIGYVPDYLLGRSWSGEVAFTNAPVVRKIKGYKALTENPISDDSEWPQNKIYRKEGNNYIAVNSRPENWSNIGVWNHYYIHTQVGANYGICTAAYDDLGILFNPLWIRAGLIDHPLINIPYDMTYTDNALDIATYNRGIVPNIYESAGWIWKTIPDARWDAPKYGSGSGGKKLSELYSSKPKFRYDSMAGAMFKDKNNDGSLTFMPDDWDTNWGDYYKSSYETLYVSDPHTSYMFSHWGCGLWYGPPFSTGTANPGSWYEGVTAGIHAPLLKSTNSSNSIIITVVGYTRSQHVKPGTIATFKVNVTSVVLTATFTYTWQESDGSDWKVVGSGGPTYSFAADASQNGHFFRCIVEASYTVFGETITGRQTAPPTGSMSLTVDEEGTEGKEPSDYGDETEEKKDNTQDPDMSEPKDYLYLFEKDDGTYAMYNNYYTDSNGKRHHATYAFKWVGDGTPPDKVELDGIAGNPNFEYSPEKSSDREYTPNPNPPTSLDTKNEPNTEELYHLLITGQLGTDINNPAYQRALEYIIENGTAEMIQGANAYSDYCKEADDVAEGSKATRK